ncbi:MAG: T9SS type A sorting domain-containing protein [Bacteroidetes bacterium]|nr:T9SS type A sorting domain-containing protein [Bacteroidota bacterium]
MGKVVLQEQEISLGTDGVEMDLSLLPSGMYLVNFKSEGIHVIERLVIE